MALILEPRALSQYDAPMALDERAFFNDKPETRVGRYECPKCHRSNDYSIRWVRRSKKDRLPAVLTFVTTASSLSFFGIGAAFWGLIAGGILMALLRWRPQPLR